MSGPDRITGWAVATVAVAALSAVAFTDWLGILAGTSFLTITGLEAERVCRAAGDAGGDLRRRVHRQEMADLLARHGLAGPVPPGPDMHDERLFIERSSL